MLGCQGPTCNEFGNINYSFGTTASLKSIALATSEPVVVLHILIEERVVGDPRVKREVTGLTSHRDVDILLPENTNVEITLSRSPLVPRKG